MRSKTFRAFGVVSLGILLLLAAPAFAQFQDKIIGFNFNNPMSASAFTMVMNNAREEALAKDLGVSQPRGRTTTVQNQPSQPVNDAALRFQPTGTRIKTHDLAESLGSTPAQRQQYETLMNAVLQVYEGETQKVGMQNDLATALSFFFAENIRIYRGQQELPDSQFVAVRNTIAQVLSAQGAFRNATDRQKQEMWETLIAYTGLTLYGYNEALKANQDEMAKGYRKVAGQNLQSVTKLSPDDINLTATGLAITRSAAQARTPR